MALFKVPLMEDESLTSFTSRFANANARSAMEFCSDFGFSFRSVVAGENGVISRLSELSGIEYSKLDAAAVKRCGKKSVWVAGEETPFMFQMRGVLKFCPACFEEDESREDIKPKSRKYIRKLWYTRFIRTCPAHRQSLVSAGTHGQPDHIHDLCWSLDYLRRDVAIASRGSEPQEFTPFENYVRTRLRGLKPGNDFLDKLSLFVAGDVCELAGMVALHGKKVSINDKTERQRWEAGSKGFELFESGLDGFHRFLSDLASQCDIRRASLGGNELFGKFHETLTNSKRDEAYSPVKDAARSYAFATLPLTDATVLFGKGGNGKFVSFSSLEKKYRVSEPILRKYLMSIGGTTTLPGSNVAAIPAQEAGQLVLTMKDLIRGAEAAKLLGVTVNAFDLLVGHGLVTTTVARDEENRFSARYSRAALTDFRDALLARATTNDLEGLVPIKSVGKTLLTTLVSILQPLMRGELKTIGVDPTGSGIMALMLDRSEVQKALVRKNSTERGDYLSSDNLAIGLRAQKTSINRLIKAGHMESSIRRHPMTGYPQRVVSKEAARAFWGKHITLSECCNRTGHHHASIRRILATAGVDRVSYPEELRELFFPRTEATAALGLPVLAWNDFETNSPTTSRAVAGEITLADQPDGSCSET
ncbi:TniQ family protein [Agrobacterium rosae]|uniref:TniQ family protein n=1 Tax=Agrobacterium rosae TaxID=1972867 RepID=UPI003B9E68F8